MSVLIRRVMQCMVVLIERLLESVAPGPVNFPLGDALRAVSRVLHWQVSAQAPPEELFSQVTVLPEAQALACRVFRALLQPCARRRRLRPLSRLRFREHLCRDAESLLALLVRTLSANAPLCGRAAHRR